MFYDIEATTAGASLYLNLHLQGFFLAEDLIADWENAVEGFFGNMV